MISVSSLTYIQKYLTLYGITTYVILGSIGLIFNLIIFRHQNPSSLFIFTASFCALLGLLLSTIPVIYEVNHPNSISSSQFYCQLQFYFRHSCNQMMRTFFILVSLDRYAISSKNTRIRSFSQYKIAIRIIPLVIFVWLIISILPTMLRSYENKKCDAKIGWQAYIYSIYIIFSIEIFPLISAILCRISLHKNLRKMQKHILSQEFRRRKRDRDMIRMLQIEIICHISTTTPLVIMLIYNLITQYDEKNAKRLAIESFGNYLTRIFLLFANNTFSFWVYLCASKSFRFEFRNLILKFYRLIREKNFISNSN